MLTRDQLKVGGKYIHPDRNEAEIRCIGEKYLLFFYERGDERNILITIFLDVFSMIPKPKTKLSRYRFTNLESNQTFEDTTFYSETGNYRKENIEHSYFNESYFSRVKIGEEIDAPWSDE